MPMIPSNWRGTRVWAGLVLKSTYFPTIAMAEIIGKLIPEVKVFGAVCLDNEIGGLNHEALEPLAKFGTKVVWMPTHSSTNSRATCADWV